MNGQGTKWHGNIAENFSRLSRVHERYRQTDRQTSDDSEREREFTLFRWFVDCVRVSDKGLTK